MLPTSLRVATAAACLCLAILNPGCNCGSQATPLPFTAHIGDTLVKCQCNVRVCYLNSLGTPVSCDGNPADDMGLNTCGQTAAFTACLPPELNTYTIGDGGLPGLQDMGDTEFEKRVNEYCATQIPNVLYHVVGTLNGGPYGFCKEKECIAPDGGIGGSIYCFAQPFDEKVDGGSATAENTFCQSPCGNVACDFQSNCTFNNVANGDVHPEKCKCNQVINGGCDGDNSPVFCQPPPAMGDPPVLTSSLMTRMVSKPIEVRLDPTQSEVEITLSEAGQNVTRTSPIHGSVTFYGSPCAKGTSCDLLMDFDIHPEDFGGANKFHFDVLPDESLTNLSIYGGTTTFKAHIDAGGIGTIKMGQLSTTAFGNQIEDGLLSHKRAGYLFSSPNSDDVLFRIDFSHDGQFLLGPASLSAGGTASATGQVVLVGRVENLPPVAHAGSYAPFECDSPGGAHVTLDGSGSSDPDGDRLFWAWSKGSTFDPAQAVPSVGAKASFVAPLGSTSYSLSVSDSRFTTSFDSTTISVQDTAAPTIALQTDPSCMWPPNHNMVLFAPNMGLTMSATDACDSGATVKIIDVSSDQPPLGGGSGAAAPDVIFGDNAFCVRSERDGTAQADRVYTVTVEARDASGNVSHATSTVRVAHDQSDGKCTQLDSARVVADDDPRCRGVVGATPAVPAAVTLTPNDGTGPVSRDKAGCEFTPRGRDQGGLLAIILVTLAMLVRRRLGLLVGAALIFTTAATGCNSATTDLSQCVVGWWQKPTYDSCLCPGQPECAPGDCKAISFTGFVAGGTYFSGTVSWSASAQTMSTISTVTQGTFTVSGSSVTFNASDGSSSTFNVNCGSGQLTMNGATKTRASNGLATALASDTASSLTWQSKPVQQ